MSDVNPDETAPAQPAETPEEAAGTAYLHAALSQILTHEDPEAFHGWIRESAEEHRAMLLGEHADAEEDELRAVALMVGRALWNVTPLPSHGMRAKPLPAIKRNDSCPCGSGDKFKKCCGGFGISGQGIEFDAGLIEMMAFDVLTPEMRAKIKGLDNGGSDRQCVMIATRELDEGQPAKAVEMMVPVLERGMSSQHPLYAAGFDTMIRSLAELERYEEIGSWSDRASKIRRASPLRAAGRVQLAEICVMEGEHEHALELVRLAKMDDPDAMDLPANEVSALRGLGQTEDAIACAQQWIDDLLADEEIDRHEEVDVLEELIEEMQLEGDQAAKPEGSDHEGTDGESDTAAE